MSCFILRDHCGVWRIMVAVTLLSGVLILSRPESLFESGVDRAANKSSSSNTSHHPPSSRNPGPDDAHQGQYDVVGLLSAMAVPILSAWIVIITRC